MQFICKWHIYKAAGIVINTGATENYAQSNRTYRNTNGFQGAYWYTPHKVVLDWMSDVMDVLQGYNIGYALWNFRGQFGILDSMRKDCRYEEWHGHLLDRQMLEILKAH